MSVIDPRFSGIARLYGEEAYSKIQSAHICIVGVGGVGSWAAEALARTGIGAITLIDLDDVCISNVNRQIHALDGYIGKPKISVMEERIRAIHPDCIVNTQHRYLTKNNLQDLIRPEMNYVFDAIDSVNEKCALIHYCKQLNIPCITAGGAGGRRSSTSIQIKDLSRSFNDPLLLRVRKVLRRDYGFTRSKKKKFKVDCVFSPESIYYPQSDGSTACDREEGSELGLNCDAGFGTASFVTGAFAFAAVAHIIEQCCFPTSAQYSVEQFSEDEKDPILEASRIAHKLESNLQDD